MTAMKCRRAEIYIEDTLPEVIKRLQSLIDQHGKDARLEFDIQYDSVCSHVVYRSPETSEEEQQRLLEEDRYTRMRKLQYENLKKEFEK